MSKSTPDAVERDLTTSMNNFRDRAVAVKNAHRAAKQELRNDPMTSDLAKREHLESLDRDTRSKLNAIREEQESYVGSLHDKLERELLGSQPSDANSVLLRRDAADRARRIADEREALTVLGDAARSGDDSLAHAVGHRARQSGWVDALDRYKQVQPESADTAAALAVVEGLGSDRGYNLANGITYAAP